MGGCSSNPALLLGAGYHCTLLLGLAGVGGEEARHSRGGWHTALGPFSLADAGLGEHRGETALKAGCMFFGFMPHTPSVDGASFWVRARE